MFGQQIPVEPTRIVVLAVGIIVAALTTPHLVAHNKHGHTCGQHDGCEKVLHLPVAEPLDFGIVRRTFEAAVPASVVVASVAVALAVFFVVLVVIGDEVVQRKTIVARNEIDTLLDFALPLTINAWAAKQTIGYAPHRIIRAPEEVADIIAKSVVPLLPAVSHEAADLIKSCRVPCLRDHLRTGQRRVGLDVPKHRRIRHDGAGRIARQDGCKIEAEPIHMHLVHPVTEAVHNHAPYNRMVRIQRVSCAGEVRVA